MKMIKAVTEKDLHLEGVEVNFQQVDGKVEAITITDKNGKYIRIVKDGTYSENLKVLIEEPKEFETAYKLTVKLDDCGVGVFMFDNKEKLDRKIASMYINESDYTVEEIQVEVKKDLSGYKLCQDGSNILDIPF